ncbi:hypothetical protein HDE_07393 [Halotydeus destructor]|nr:hypothetical protein HDE_07393 [Halotydeus destructor]
MAHTVDTLQAVFENSEAKLNVVLCEVEKCFADYDNQQQKNQEEDNLESAIAMNPVKIISDLKELAHGLDKVKAGYAELKQKENDLSGQLDVEYSSIQQEVRSVLKSLKN